MAIAYISHHDCQLHDMGHHHPEQPARLSAINDRLIATGLEMILHQYDAPLATRECAALVDVPLLTLDVLNGADWMPDGVRPAAANDSQIA